MIREAEQPDAHAHQRDLCWNGRCCDCPCAVCRAAPPMRPRPIIEAVVERVEIVRPEFPPGTSARFWAKVDRRGPDECWPWTAARNTKRGGYGTFSIKSGGLGSTHRAHRWAWELTRGVIPPGLMLCHRCDVPLCVRGDHLFAGTGQQNVDDRNRKGRQARGPLLVAAMMKGRRCRGSASPHAKLTDEIVAEARHRCRAGARVADLAREFGVSDAVMRNAVRGRKWTHVAEPPVTAGMGIER